MEPRYLTYVVTANLLLCGCWKSRILGYRSVTIGEWRARVSSYPVRGNPALCWQSSGLVLGDVFPEAFSCGNGKFLGLTICWKSNSQYETCTVLVVEPAMECGGNLLLNIVSYSRHTIMVVCWLRFIFYFRNKFFLHYALVII